MWSNTSAKTKDDKRNTKALRDRDEYRKHKKKRWGQISTEIIREVYVCIDVARPQRKRRVRNRTQQNSHPSLRRRHTDGNISAPSALHHQQCGDCDINDDRQENTNSFDATTPIRTNIPNRNVSSTFKRSLSFMRGYNDTDVDDESCSYSTAPEKMTSMAMAKATITPHTKNVHSVQRESSPDMVMTKSSKTPPQSWLKKREEEDDYHVTYGSISRSLGFKSECGVGTKTAGVEEDEPNHGHHPQNEGHNYASDTDDGANDLIFTESDDDDSSVSFTSISFDEEYNFVAIRILQEDEGKIILEYPDNNNVNQNDKPNDAVGRLRAPNIINDNIDGDSQHSKPTVSRIDDLSLDDSTTASLPSVEFTPTYLRNNNMTPPHSPSTTKSTTTASISTATMATSEPRRRRKISRTRLDRDISMLNPPEFELTSDKKRTEEDETEKELMACFKANEESLLKLNFTVSDLIRAEVDEERNQSDSKVGNDTIDESNAKTPKRFTFDLPKFLTPRKRTDEDENNKKTATTTQSQQTPLPPPNKIIKRLILSEQDEIHVSPCQCALSLVGMTGLTPLNSQVISDGDGESMFNNFLSLISPPANNTSVVSSSILKVPSFWGAWGRGSNEIDDTNNDKHDGSDPNAISPLLPRKELSFEEEEKEPRVAKLVRTKSAQAADAKDSNTKDSAKKTPRKSMQPSGVNWSLAKTESERDDDLISDIANQPQQQNSQRLAVRRDKRWDYESIGYHEITLIRNRIDGNSESKGGDIHAEEGLIDWDAVTIRCSNHDELDILVQSLKESSCATVVPFSSNPKEKLKINTKKRVKYIQHEPTKPDIPNRVKDNRNILNGGIEGRANLNSNTNRDDIATHIREDDCDVLNTTQAKKGDEKDLQKNISDSHADEDNTSANKFIKKIPWDFNFNKKEYCELCNLYFTLLTRRHHCRQCERSCCGHCSSVLLVKGGGEKRYCNRCSADILRIQTEALHKRLRSRISETVLPGKVHSACHRLGVGVIGKLPHWKNYIGLSAEQRPAVGRLTVEVLEAMALPSVDKVNGIVDPYVRATITGYDRDLFWFLREWLPSKRFSLCSGYCTSTVSPLWHGCGRSGGERLTLPVISTAGAVLRLEVLHYNVLTNARGKDSVLGIVEIPLSDLPNANMKHIEGLGIDSSKEKAFDGYCDRWYRLLPVDYANNNIVILSKPISSPHSKRSSDKDKERPGNKTMKSLEEIGKRFQGLCIAPVEWFASAIKLDLPARRPEAICEEHKARSTLHVRIKLNACHAGDLFSHAWFPPVKPRPSTPPFDPQSLLTHIQQIIKLLEPYGKIFQYVEEVIKWKHETKTCLKAYCIFAFHMILFPHTLRLLHIYLIIFLGVRLRQMNDVATDAYTDNDEDYSTADAHADGDSPIDHSIQQTQSINSEDSGIASTQSCASPVLEPSDQIVEFRNSPSLGHELNLSEQLSTPSKAGKRWKLHQKSQTSFSDTEEEEEDSAKLNKAVNWIAKRLGHNKGLDIFQYKMTFLERDLRNINSVWDGSNRLLTRTAIACIITSFVLHFLVRRRVLWLVGTSTWYFAQAPRMKLYARAFLGFFSWSCQDHPKAAFA